MEIIIGEENVNLGDGGQITGEIYFKINDYYFPERRWNDFFVTILQWWVHNYITAIRSNSYTFEFHFMDGPYSVKAVLIEKNLYEIRLLMTNENNNTEIVTTHVCPKELQDMLIKACKRAFKVLWLAEIPSDKAVGLKSLYEELKKL
ncbi:MAG: hypothetical protein K2O32_07890 [Acetatifactor sp.]|nr:hypothetical protein [Acetatifactor sp.]